MTTTEITWEHKLAAMSGLGECSLKMQAPGSWYVHQPGVEIKDVDPRGGEASGQKNAQTPEAAVDRRWSQLIDTSEKRYVEHKRGRIIRRVRWNGFMWADLQFAGDGDGESASATA